MSVASCAKATFSRTSRNVAGTVVMVEPPSSGICHWSLPVSADRAIPPRRSALGARTQRSPSNRFRLTGRHEMAFEPGTRDAHIGRQTTTAVEPLAPPELLLLPGSDRVDDVARDAETAHDVVVEHAH